MDDKTPQFPMTPKGRQGMNNEDFEQSYSKESGPAQDLFLSQNERQSGNINNTVNNTIGTEEMSLNNITENNNNGDAVSSEETSGGGGVSWKARITLWKRRYAGDRSIKIVTFVALIQAIISIIIEIIIALNQGVYDFNRIKTFEFDPTMNSILSNSKALNVYYGIFCFAQLSYLLLLIVSIITGSIVEYIASVIVSVTLLTYSFVQALQTQDVANAIRNRLAQLDPSIRTFKPSIYLFGIICTLLLINTIVQAVFAKKIRNSFGWRTFRELGADLNTKKRLRFYQIYMVLLKLSTFFFIGFDIQFLILPIRREGASNNSSFPLPTTIHLIIALPINIFTIIIAYCAQKRESKILMFLTAILLQIESIYIISKIYDVIHPPPESPDKYVGSKNSILFFEVTALILSQLTFIIGIKNYFSYGKGLKSLVERSNREVLGIEKPRRTRSYYNNKLIPAPDNNVSSKTFNSNSKIYPIYK